MFTYSPFFSPFSIFHEDLSLRLINFENSAQILFLDHKAQNDMKCLKVCFAISLCLLTKNSLHLLLLHFIV